MSIDIIYGLSLCFVEQEFIQAYVTSITSLEADHLLEASKDSRGARVIEAFLSSNASGKLKRKLVVKYVMQQL